jgi:hypothetical protein
MPVTTRSQSKLLTGSDLALSQVLSTGSTELSDISDKFTSQRNNNHPSSPVNLSISSTSSIVLPSITHHCSLCRDDFETSIQNGKDFEISKSHPLRNSKLYLEFPTPELSHNFENLQTFFNGGRLQGYII